SGCTGGCSGGPPRSTALFQMPPEEVERQGQHERLLLVRRGPGVSSLDVLVEEHAVPHRQHPGGHLARVSWVHAVVARGCGEQHGWILHSSLEILIRRPGAHELPFLGIV